MKKQVVLDEHFSAAPVQFDDGRHRILKICVYGIKAIEAGLLVYYHLIMNELYQLCLDTSKSSTTITRA